jgi:hypothetical protein
VMHVFSAGRVSEDARAIVPTLVRDGDLGHHPADGTVRTHHSLLWFAGDLPVFASLILRP